MRRPWFALFVTFVTFAISPAAPSADAAGLDHARPRSYAIEQPLRLDEAGVPVRARAGIRRRLFVNRGGATMSPGPIDNSSGNVSTIVSRASAIPAFTGSDAQWNAIMDCTRVTFEPFNILVTDEDPGIASHVECVVGGYPQDIGAQDDAGGVAPTPACDNGIIERAVVYAFSEVWGEGNTVDICATIAQESAHAFGLDHEFMCEDPMTYLFGCGFKRFQDLAVPCGEYSARGCRCGNTTQNSFQELRNLLGAPDPNPPLVEITGPLEGATVKLGFTIQVAASDDTGINRVELYVDGAKQHFSVDNTPTYALETPNDLAIGEHDFLVIGYDNGGNFVEDAVHAVVEAACGSDAECDGGLICVVGACVVPLGGDCFSNNQCDSGLCLGVGGLGQVCTSLCASSAECPSNFECRTPETGGADKCLVVLDDSCSTTGTGRGSRSATWLLMVAGALFVLQLRRQRRPERRPNPHA
ncbi:MAG: hypothetical protein EXR73_11790 [Myxococcales bacterium]|nr:hypothetical protein [Myxococcales bacterium]